MAFKMTAFFSAYLNSKQTEINAGINSANAGIIPGILEKEKISFDDFLVLLSPGAGGYLDDMAMKAKALTDKHFGKNINLYIPMYLSNECNSSCVYCGFNRMSKIQRKTLTINEIALEAGKIREYGMTHILLLTGDSKENAPLEYIEHAVREVKKLFPQVSLEIYPLDTQNYKRLVDSSATGLTIYQETYDRKTYEKVHKGGAKEDIEYRLAAPERALDAGFRKIGIGALLGLSDWRTEAACLAMHAEYLMKKYWRADISISFPRLRKSGSGFRPYYDVTDKELAQMIFAFRIFLDRAGIVLSTRESPYFRDNMIGYGVTMMSAGSKTNPGGYAADGEDSGRQFETEDGRTIEEISGAIKNAGYYPVFKDWEKALGGVKK
jgi:2-iminoacetate synthase